MIPIKKFLIRWPFGCLILFNTACENKSSYKSYIPTQQDTIAIIALAKRANTSIAAIKHTLKDGDLVTRTGNDFTSESLRSLNQRDKTYSHCGIASIENDSVFVYHALGGDFNPDQKILRESLETFAEPFSNKGIGIYRFSVADNIRKRFAANANGLYRKAVTFDMEFDLATDEKMYCAEFVYKCLKGSGKDSLTFNLSRIRQFTFIGVDDLFLHPMCKMQAQIVYK